MPIVRASHTSVSGRRGALWGKRRSFRGPEGGLCMNRTISVRLGAIAAASFAALAFASGPASADPTGGANSGCEAYAPWGVGEPSGNGVATTQPAAGTKGNADTKCPPGQAPDGSDNNKG